jgi:hypothetical protein
MIGRRFVVGASALTILAMGAGGAAASWTAKSGTGSVGKASTLTVPQTTGVAAADGAGQSVITWNAVSFGPGITGYRVQRYTAAAPATTGQTAVCASALTSTATTCTDTGVSAGSYFYSVTALYKPASDATVNWSGAESLRDPATVTAVASLSISSVVRDSGNKKVHFTGTGAVATTNIVVTICAVNSFPCASPVTTSTATAPSAGGWTSGQSGANLNDSTQYYAQAVQGSTKSASFPFTVTAL